ncbi:high-potential iron-sulfur protein [Lysobacter niastensis]|uniref:High-potential iron-sulfur protein n=1 Tax=Lysobacter niastensis TaxID=380629 RepID=A0ABS0B5S4_9GAMM|nr:high-potential iron-sulfur protein [Lysobacter niastensis]MBF6023478.1 high-potential iron-sulfur protein [Lysobacter niastensis]
MNVQDPSRRRFLVQAIAVSVAAMAVNTAAGQAAKPAAALPKLPLDNPTAKALAYTENAASVKHPSFKPGSHCANCNLYKGVAGQAYGPCQLFPQNSVAAKGWCSGWAKKV